MVLGGIARERWWWERVGMECCEGGWERGSREGYAL